MNKDLKLRVSGNIPSFKNRKRAILDSRTGKMRTMTDKKIAKRMSLIIRSIESQLLSYIRTIGGETLTAQRVRFLIVSSLPLDDCRQWVSELCVKAVNCDKGREGAEIVIEQIE